jgi:CDP-glucose 4,6-dehydratase
VEDVVNADHPFWRDRPTLVTGATGLLGTALVSRLLEAGAHVVCLIRDWIPQSELVGSGALERVRVARGDLRDQALLERVMGEHEIDTVMHLAAQAVVSIAQRNPISTLETNVAGTWRLLEAARRSPTVRQIVVTSSDKAYGEQPELPYRENTPLQGRHPYDVSKSCADLICQMYAHSYGTPVCITRCGNFYGPGDLNWNRLVPGTFRSAFLGQRPIVRSNGQLVRDYIHVDDGAAAHIALAHALAQRRELAGQAFNFSNQEPLTALEMVARVLAAAGRSELEPDVRDQASGEIPRQFLATDKARELLGWAPRWSLDEGLRETAGWYERFVAKGLS